MLVVKNALNELQELRAQFLFLELALTDKQELKLCEQELLGLTITLDGMKDKFYVIENLLNIADGKSEYQAESKRVMAAVKATLSAQRAPSPKDDQITIGQSNELGV